MTHLVKGASTSIIESKNGRLNLSSKSKKSTYDFKEENANLKKVLKNLFVLTSARADKRYWELCMVNAPFSEGNLTFVWTSVYSCTHPIYDSFYVGVMTDGQYAGQIRIYGSMRGCMGADSFLRIQKNEAKWEVFLWNPPVDVVGNHTEDKHISIISKSKDDVEINEKCPNCQRKVRETSFEEGI